MNITKIYYPEKHKSSERGVLRVAAYCRVSTTQTEQESSYEEQVAVYTERINGQKGWKLAGIYADQGISGTSAKRRPEFLRLIKDCERGLIDVIICKSFSRFARNTQEMIFYVRHLHGLGVQLIFEKEKVDTDERFSEMTMTILAAFAEEESRSLSENVKWGKRKRAQAGETPMVRIYGYDNTGENYVIIPEEAETVRRIFALYEHGYDGAEIAREISAAGILTAKGNTKWNANHIRRMIENEKYVGDYKTQKVYTPDFREKKCEKNEGLLPSVYIENHHPAIISRERFNRCQVIMNLRRNDTPLKYPFGEYLRCPFCGHLLYSRTPIGDACFFCEGEGACRRFVIRANPVKEAILKAYNGLNIDEVQRIANSSDQSKSSEAKKLLEAKEKYPSFDAVHYWWLDDLVECVSFGQHSHIESELKIMDGEAPAIDDRTVSVCWRCGLTTTLSSGVLKDNQDPRRKAEMWDAYILRHPDRYPQLATEVKQAGEIVAGE